MKFALVLVLLPLAFAAPEKRFFLNDLLDLTEIRTLVGQLAHQLGNEPSEQVCESACHGILMGETGLLHEACPLVCRSFQRLVEMFDTQPQDETTPPPTVASQ